MSETKNRLERTCLFGAYEFTDLEWILDPVVGVDANFGFTDRAMFFWPGGPWITRVVAGEIQKLPGQYIAPCAAGFVVSRPIQTSLTFKTLAGFNIPQTQKLSVNEKSLAGGAGVSIVTPLAAGGKVIDGITTCNSGRAIEEEYSVRRIRDLVAKTCRKGLENAFVGSLITPNTPKEIETAVNSILAAMLSQGIITKYANVKAFVDSTDPRQVNVTFDITPIFPLKWVYIKFSASI
jgi:hypothetical protein